MEGECINGLFVPATTPQTVRVQEVPVRKKTTFQGCRRCGSTPCTCPPEAPEVTTEAVKLQVLRGDRTAASIQLMQPTPRRAPVAVCRTCRAVTCRCGVPAAPDTLGESALRRQARGC